jgi:iron complex outermembrane recepter protein
MKVNHTVARAVGAILGAHAGAAVFAATPAADSSASATGIEEIVVTAQRRSENAQDVPIAMQAFSEKSLAQLNVVNFEDMIKYLPAVSASTAAPGQSSIFMRGLSVGDQGTQSGGSINGFPNVAIYLDDQSGQLPGRNLDVYAADLERVEVLEGPQGTLFGAGAQAGVIRYITNKPKLDKTEISATASYGVTSGGDPNSDMTGVFNLPLVDNKLGVRAVIYNDRRGGYINNVPGTFTRQSSDLGIHYANYPDGCIASQYASPGDVVCQPPPGASVLSNANIARHAINPVTYTGIRASVLWDINDDWNALITQSYQNIDAQGVFYQMPNGSDGEPLPKQSVTLFNDSWSKDKFTNTAWTLNGRIGALKALYTGSYLSRDIEQQQDYTNYSRGLYADYYQCHGAEPGNGLAASCNSPSSTWTEVESSKHISHEFRLSTPDTWRLRGIVGAFWEKLDLGDQLNWLYKTLPSCTDTVTVGCLTNIATVPGSSVNNPGTRADHVSFFNDVKRGYKQTAFFASLDFDLIPKVLTLTAGTRYFHFDNYEKGTVGGSFGCYEFGPAPCLASMTSIDDENLNSTEKGFRSRANLTWRPLPDVLIYYTWSQGYRPGAFNRSFGCYIPNAQGIPLYCSPLSFQSDDLNNNEIGWKTEFANHRLQWNGALYQEDWKNVQVAFFDPGVLGNVGFGTNGPNYRVRGVETSVVAQVGSGFTVMAAASWNSSQQTNSPFLIANNPDLKGDPASAADFGKPILSVQNPYGTPGSPSANSPPLQYNVRLRYQWNWNSYNAFWQVAGTHTAHSFTQSSSSPALSQGGHVSTTLVRFENPAYTQFDASIGVARDAWTMELYSQNLTDKNVSTFTSTNQFVVAENILRPRIIELKVGYKF